MKELLAIISMLPILALSQTDSGPFVPEHAWQQKQLTSRSLQEEFDQFRALSQGLTVKTQLEVAQRKFAQAKLELDKGDTQKAAEDLRRVVQLLPDYAEGHLTLAEALAKQGDSEGSIPEFKRALELEPNLYPADIGLGEILRGKGSFADAESAFRDAIRLRPSQIHSGHMVYSLGLKPNLSSCCIRRRRRHLQKVNLI